MKCVAITANIPFLSASGVAIDSIGLMIKLFRPSFRILTLAALALLVAGVFAPTKGRAECGDYVKLGGKTPSMLPHESHPSNAPVPCHGPNCSQTPRTPIMPPAPPPTITPGEWASLLSQLSDPSPIRCGFVREHSDGQAILHSDPIFHPPRFIV